MGGAGTTGTIEGTGLGLYISQRLASQLGGVISFTSEFGRGSVFKLTLPVRPSEKGDRGTNGRTEDREDTTVRLPKPRPMSAGLRNGGGDR